LQVEPDGAGWTHDGVKPAIAFLCCWPVNRGGHEPVQRRPFGEQLHATPSTAYISGARTLAAIIASVGLSEPSDADDRPLAWLGLAYISSTARLVADGAETQVEGAALWGLSMALHEGTELLKGQPKDTTSTAIRSWTWATCRPSRSSFFPSTEGLVGLGEPATIVVGPAIGNQCGLNSAWFYGN
jgi:hypothetical protein